jgi:hypothetical protein
VLARLLPSRSLRRGLLAAASLLLADPAQAARIEGQVVAHGDHKLKSPVPVMLFEFDRAQGGPQVVDETKTDRSGRFAFSDVRSPGLYWVSMRHEGITYPGRVVEVTASEAEKTKSVSLALYEHTREGPPIEIDALALIIQPEEAGVFRFNHQVYFENPQPVVIDRKADGRPVVRVGLAPGHEKVNGRMFPFLPIEFGTRGSELEIYGPIFPSQQVAELEYAVNGKGRNLETVIDLPQSVGELRLLLPAAGFVLEAPTLHPGPPRLDERTKALQFQQFIGFNLPAGTRIPLRMRARNVPQPPSAALMVLGVTLLFALLAGGVLQPVLSGRAAAVGAARAAGGSGENDALFVALRDLEEDFELGKVSSEDRERMREELRREALGNLARQAASREPARAAPAEPQRCACGHQPQAGARFCSACGRPIA